MLWRIDIRSKVHPTTAVSVRDIDRCCFDPRFFSCLFFASAPQTSRFVIVDGWHLLSFKTRKTFPWLYNKFIVINYKENKSPPAIEINAEQILAIEFLSPLTVVIDFMCVLPAASENYTAAQRDLTAHHWEKNFLRFLTSSQCCLTSHRCCDLYVEFISGIHYFGFREY